MPDIDRRSFVAGAWGVLGLMQNVSAATPSGGDPGRPPAGAAAEPHASDTLPAVTRTLATKDGSRVEKFVEHAVGSLERPLSDRDLDAKVRDLCDGVLIADAGRAS